MKMATPRSKVYFERMVVFLWNFLMSTSTVSGTYLELTSPGKIPVDTSQFGVDVARCSSITFQLKACENAHLWLGDGTGAGSYEAAIGVDEYTAVHWRPCSICYSESSRLKKCLINRILDCHSYRTFWLSWKDNQLSLGLGDSPNVNTICSTPNPGLHEIRVLGFMGYDSYPVALRLGDENVSRLEVVSDDAVYSENPVAELTNNFFNCTLSCHYHDSCGMVSYNGDQSTCKLFDRMTSSFVLKRETGWKSWMMRYCWP